MILDLELHTLAQIYDDRPPSTQKMSRKEPDTAASLGHIPHMRQQEYTASHLVGPDRRHQIDQFHDHGIAHVCPKIGHLVQICKHILATQHGSSSTSNAHPRHRPKPQLLSSYVARDLICLQPATGGTTRTGTQSRFHTVLGKRGTFHGTPPPPPPRPNCLQHNAQHAATHRHWEAAPCRLGARPQAAQIPAPDPPAAAAAAAAAVPRRRHSSGRLVRPSVSLAMAAAWWARGRAEGRARGGCPWLRPWRRGGGGPRALPK